MRLRVGGAADSSADSRKGDFQSPAVYANESVDYVPLRPRHFARPYFSVNRDAISFVSATLRPVVFTRRL